LNRGEFGAEMRAEENEGKSGGRRGKGEGDEAANI